MLEADAFLIVLVGLIFYPMVMAQLRARLAEPRLAETGWVTLCPGFRSGLMLSAGVDKFCLWIIAVNSRPASRS